MTTLVAHTPVLLLRKFDWRQAIIYIGFTGLFLFFAVTLGDVGFLTANNLLNVFRQTATISVMAVATFSRTRLCTSSFSSRLNPVRVAAIVGSKVRASLGQFILADDRIVPNERHTRGRRGNTMYFSLDTTQFVFQRPIVTSDFR